jgi:hypothetical protein
MSTADPVAVSAAIERRIASLSAAEPAPAALEAQELVRLVMSLYGAGLSRMLDIVRADVRGREMLARFESDPLVASLFALHDLQPHAPADPPLIQIRRSAKPAPSLEPAGSHTATECDVCRTPLSGGHRHVVDIHTRRLLCACATCGGPEGRYRVVPDRYVHDPSMTLSPAQWEALGIPVGLVFFVFNSHLGRTIACYPGPAGATESVLPLDGWPALMRESPWLAAVSPDVEALLVRRVGETYRCFVVPVDVCYELAGRIRQTWTGIGGGEAAESEIDGFFAAIRGRCAAAPYGERA